MMMFSSTVTKTGVGLRARPNISFVPRKVRRTRFGLLGNAGRREGRDGVVVLPFKNTLAPGRHKVQLQTAAQNEPLLTADQHGMPTGEFLDKVIHWKGDPVGLLVFVEKACGETFCWHLRNIKGENVLMCSPGYEPAKAIVFWALKTNGKFWGEHWRQSHSAGAHWFKLPASVPAGVLSRWHRNG